MQLSSQAAQGRETEICYEEKKKFGKKGRKIILTALLKARDIKEQAMNEAMVIEREISSLRALKKKLEMDIG